MASVTELPPEIYDAQRLRQRRDVRRIPYTITVGAAATAVALIAGWVSVRGGLATAYPDAVSHASIARRLWDGQNPGFGQLGTVWLPIPHLLLLPFTLLSLISEQLWRDGIPAVLLSSLCMGFAAASIYRILVRWGVRSAWIMVVALGVYVLNPSTLYVHTTAMTEPVLMASIAMSAAGLSGFLSSQRPLTGGELAVYAGIPAAAAVGSRYDGWVFTAGAAVMLVAVAQARWGHWRYSLRIAAAFCTPPAVIAIWWIVLNATQYGDVLAFQRGPYSAAALQRQFADLGLLPTQGSLAVSLDTYSWVIWYVLGPAVIAGMVIGLVLIALRERPTSGTVLVWLLLFPLPYHVLALYSGQSVIWHPHTDPPGLFNVRYALPLVLPAALAIGYAMMIATAHARRRAAVVAALTAVVIGASYVYQVLDPATRAPVIAEAQTQIPKTQVLRDMAAYLDENASPGDTVMVDETVTAILGDLGWRFNRVIGQFTDSFDEQLRQPSATWLIVNRDVSSDRVWQALQTNPRFPSEYAVVFEQGSYVILRRV